MKMSIYNKKEIEIFKRVVEDYKKIKSEIETRINNGYTFENLVDYIRHLANCNITNYGRLEGRNYVDFNYNDMCITIIETNHLFLNDYIEVWNDEETYYIGTFSSVEELENIIKGSE